MNVSKEEIRDILISWLVLSFAFTKLFSSDFFDFAQFPGMVIIVGTAFVLHEMAHKVQAQRFGYPAEYRMWPAGLLLALASSFAGFIFAAPGAVQIFSYEYDEKAMGRIASSGPASNMIVALLFLPLSLFFKYKLFAMVAGINAAIALFNLFPIGPLDGRKILAYNKMLWGLLALMAFVIVIITQKG